MKFIPKFLLVCLFGFSLSGCSKKGDDAGTVSTDFYFPTNAYLKEDVYFTMDNPDHQSYTINFGDGASQSTTGSPHHAYTVAGIYTVTVSAGSRSTSKKIRIYPGTGSFQVQNNFSATLNSQSASVIRGGVVYELLAPSIDFPNLAKGQITDTIFVTVNANIEYDPPVSLRMHYTNGRSTDIGFITSVFALPQGGHRVFTISGTTFGKYSYRLDALNFKEGLGSLSDTVSF